jgi:hypothetical protein
MSSDGCWCDASCTQFGDCCTDVATYCTTLKQSSPTKQVTFWSDEAQGLSHDASSWYITQNKPEPRLLKVALSFNLTAPALLPGTPIATIPPSLADYNHMGDPDVYGPYVFVPLQGNSFPIIAVYRASDMSFVRAVMPSGQDPALGGGAWVAADPVRKLLYTSDNRIGVNNPLLINDIYDPFIDIPAAGFLDRSFLTFRTQITLVDRNGSPLDLPVMQGGDVSDDGRLLYLSNGCCGDHSGNDWGLRIFDIGQNDGFGHLVAQSANLVSPLVKFSFPWCDDINKLCFDEPQGVDYGQVFGAPNISSATLLHATLLSNWLPVDFVSFRHYGY